MQRKSLACLFLISLTLISSKTALATTWSPVEVTCPVCHTNNTFREIMSFGTYIYQWPSKYQLIFWPYTDSNVLYSCKKCHLTAFMGDYQKVPKEKIAALELTLKPVSLPKVDEYTQIPMSQRLLVAEKVYSVLGRDDEFWSHFYRVLGYHYEDEGKQKEAEQARRKVLEIVWRMLANQDNTGIRKELLYISGAMRFFLKDKEGALKDLKEAAALTYRSKDLTPEKSANADKYLSNLIESYIKIIQEGKPPRNEIALLQ